MERIIKCSSLTVKDADSMEYSFEREWFGSLVVEFHEVKKDTSLKIIKQGAFTAKTVLFFSKVKSYQYEEVA
jgi:hypothetical protein